MKKKKPLRFYVAMAVGKVSAIFLRMFGRRASHFPGACALQICRDFLSYLEKPNHFICVTGTNGKTTTSNLLASLLRSMGYRVTNNSFGSNIKEGVVSALMLNSTLLGVHKNEYAVIEVDERSSIRIFPEMQPDYLLCTNIMRDSIMRNAHPDFISFVINSSISENTMLILNADDFICAAIAPQCRRRFYFGISADQPAENKKYGAKDVVYCPKCGQRLIADYLRFEHIGRWRCSNCDCQ